LCSALHHKQTFIYKRYGNRSFDTSNTKTNSLGSLLTIDQATNRFTSGQGSILYDNVGNLTRDFNAHTFSYDAENHQVAYDGGASANGTDYKYDGDGRRVKKVTGTGQQTTIFIYDVSGQMVAEYSTSNQQGSGGTSYLTMDNLGTPRVVTGADGGVKARHDYLPFGEEIGLSGGRTASQGYVVDNVRQKFTQKERDVETGLDYFGARYYASTQGRFTSADPLMASGSTVDPQTWNRYSYSYNNPLRFTDPSGMLAGDYLENETGKYLGTDGQADGKYYAVTDEKEAKQIADTNKKGGTTSLASVTSAVDVTSGGYGVRQAIGDAVVRSNSPSGLDKEGGFHEEAVTWGPDANGVERPISAAPGPYSDPLVDDHAQVAPSNFANKADEGVLHDVDGVGHVHPKGIGRATVSPNSPPGSISIGGEIESKAKFVQPPSAKDIGNALPGRTNIVVGARNKTVYFYRNSGNKADCNCVARLPLKVFLSLK
jgi:RHS repeat-associated protein